MSIEKAQKTKEKFTDAVEKNLDGIVGEVVSDMTRIEGLSQRLRSRILIALDTSSTEVSSELLDHSTRYAQLDTETQIRTYFNERVRKEIADIASQLNSTEVQALDVFFGKLLGYK